MKVTWRVPSRHANLSHQEYTETESLIRHDSHYQVLICTDHGYALRNLVRHLRDEHTLSLAIRKSIQHQHQHHVCVSPDTFRSPRRPVDVVEGLKAPVVAFQCRDHDCSTIFTSIEHMSRHCSQQHGWRKSDSDPVFWSSVMAQTFFTSHYTKFFAVRIPSSPAVPNLITPESTPVSQGATDGSITHSTTISDDQRRELQQQLQAREQAVQQHEISMQKVDDEIAKQDRTGWFNRTDWPRHFAGRNIVDIAHCSRLPDKQEIVLIELVRMFDEVWKTAVNGLQSLDLETRRWLRSAKVSDPDVRPMARLQTDTASDRYAGYFRRFLCYSMRVWGGEVEAAAVYEQEQRPLQAPNQIQLRQRAQSIVDSITSYETTDQARTEGNTNSGGSESGDDADFTSTHADSTTSHPPISSTTQDLTVDARALFPWQPGQKEMIAKLYRYMTSDEDSDMTAEEGLTMLLEFCHSFIFFKIGHDQFRSGLIHFAAVLGIDEDNRRLKRASDYSYILAGLVYSIRILAVEKMIPREDRQHEDEEQQGAVRERFLQLRTQYLADGSFTPMSVMLSLLAYGKSIALQTGNQGSISWSSNLQIMYYHGQAIEIHQFRRMAHDILHRAEDMMWQELMWVKTPSDRFTIPLDQVVDDIVFSRRGYSFIQRDINGLRNGFQWMITRMVQLTTHNTLRRRGRWKVRRVRQYLRRLHHFWRLLALCVHILGGQPARGSELLSIRFRNGGWQDRNIFVIDGQVVIITRYHKSQSLMDRPKIVPRVLPWRCGQLLAIYLTYVQPFQEYLRQELDDQPWSDHLWYNDKGPWETEQLTAALHIETAAWLGHAYGTLDYRHIAVSIGRQMVGEHFSAGYKEELGEVEEPEVEEEDALELQSGRGEAMGQDRYGVPVHLVQHLSVKSLTTFRSLSEAWHRFLQLGSSSINVLPAPASSSTSLSSPLVPLPLSTPSRMPPPLSHISPSASLPSRSPVATRDLSLAAFQVAHPHSRFEPIPSAFNHRPSSSSELENRTGSTAVEPMPTRISTAMHQLFGLGPVSFTCAEQEIAITAVLTNQTPLVVILPTGGGKTLLASIAAIIDPEGTIVMVTPFRALTNDMVTRFRRDGIDCREWRHGEVNRASVVVVSADIAVGYGFLTYIRQLQIQGLLRRIFIDESHLVFTSSDWRPKLDRLRLLRTLICPMILLTATLPPMLEADLEDAMGLRTARYIRASTVRPFHRYHVQRCVRGQLMDDATAMCRRWQARLGRQKGVVYCRSKAMCDNLAAVLTCGTYHADHVDRATTLTQWQEIGGLIVATSALGTGVDIPDILVVIHVDRPWSMIDFAQESGRAGRGGEMVDSIILVEEGVVEEQLVGGQLSIDATAIAQMITTSECRRWVMSEYLDGAEYGRRCSDLVDGARCDRCGDGLTVVLAQKRRMAKEWLQLEPCLDEMATGCAMCWMLGDSTVDHRHSSVRCQRWSGLHGDHVDRFRRQTRYGRGVRSCHKCGIDQRWCASGIRSEHACQWPRVLVPVVLCALGSPVGFPIVEGLGYRGTNSDLRAYGQWLGQRHEHRVWEVWMSNAMVVMIRMIQWVIRGGDYVSPRTT